jgi:hypothetical protein
MGFVIRDGFPSSPSHTLIIPKRHVVSFFEISQEERQALFGLLEQAKQVINSELSLDGLKISKNDGPAAGQTAPYLHILSLYGDVIGSIA